MSVSNVRAAIQRFIEFPEAQVLCIRGEWGTGKTWTWDDVLKEAASNGKVKAKKYAKASLFGLNSIHELKREIFQSAVTPDQIGRPFTADSAKSLAESAKSWIKFTANKVSFLHNDGATAIIETMALFARDHLILIDDLERKGEDLRSVDVLGYISQLRDDRNSKVVLLLNDEELDDSKEFNSYLEKVVDVYLRFSPTEEEVANIAVPETDEVSVMVRNNAVELGIKNVRVIRKILALCKDLEPLLAKYSKVVTHNSVGVISLLGWSHFQPKKAPPIEYLKRVHVFAPKKGDEALDIQWRDLLHRYRYTHSSDYDLELLKGIENGYFDPSQIEKYASELHQADSRNKVEIEVRAIWDDMHYSFTKPAEGILDRFYECYVRNIAFMTLGDMTIFERLFRELGDIRSDELVDRYIAANKEKPEAFDIDRLERVGEELTPAVKEKIAAAQEQQAPKLTPDEIFIALAKRGYEEDVYDAAAKLPISEYIRVLKSHEGSELSDITSGMRQYLKTGGIDARLYTVMDKAGAALREIAKESPINNRRARRLGLIQRLEAKEAQAADEAQTSET